MVVQLFKNRFCLPVWVLIDGCSYRAVFYILRQPGENVRRDYLHPSGKPVLFHIPDDRKRVCRAYIYPGAVRMLRKGSFRVFCGKVGIVGGVIRTDDRKTVLCRLLRKAADDMALDVGIAISGEKKDTAGRAGERKQLSSHSSGGDKVVLNRKKSPAFRRV